MNARELRSALEGVHDDAEVRLMTQAHYPFEYSVEGTWLVTPSPDACRECGLTEDHPLHHDDALYEAGHHEHDFVPYNEFEPADGPASGEVLYLVEGTQLGYGTRTAWAEAERA